MQLLKGINFKPNFTTHFHIIIKDCYWFSFNIFEYNIEARGFCVVIGLLWFRLIFDFNTELNKIIKDRSCKN